MVDKDNDLFEEDQEEFEIDIEEDDSPAGIEAADEKGFEDEGEEAPAKTSEKPKQKSIEEEDARRQAEADGYEYDDLTPEEKAKYGRRAQKRIKSLVGKTKTLEEQLAAEAKRAKELEEELSKFRGYTQETTLYAIEQQTKRIEAQRSDITRKLIEAREAGDVESEGKAFSALAALDNEERQVQRAKSQYVAKNKGAANAEDGAEGGELGMGRTNSQSERTAVETTNTAVGQPDDRALDWHERNTWFGDSQNNQHKIMTARAIRIHEALLDEGFDPQTDADDYYDELDTRLRRHFKDYFKGAGVAREKPRQIVTGGSRMAGTKSKNTVKLTKAQVETAKRLGITPQQYAKELLKLERSERAS